MPAPSPLRVTTSALNRLLEEEASYHTELRDQQTRLQKLESAPSPAGDDNENVEYEIKQQKQAIEETKKVFPLLRRRIDDAMLRLEEQVESQATEGEQSAEEQAARHLMRKVKHRDAQSVGLN